MVFGSYARNGVYVGCTKNSEEEMTLEHATKEELISLIVWVNVALHSRKVSEIDWLKLLEKLRSGDIGFFGPATMKKEDK